MKRVVRHVSPKLNRLQRGLGLIEILITILVVAIGMLGMAGLLISAKQATYDSVQRTTAVQLTEDMITRMRLNSGVDELAAYVAANDVGSGTFSAAYTDPGCSSTSHCDTSDLVNVDLFDWEQQLMGVAEAAGGNNTGGLVSPTGCITVDTTTDPDIYTVAVAWRGVVARDNPTVSACGAASGLYGASNEFRRVVAVSFYPGG